MRARSIGTLLAAGLVASLWKAELRAQTTVSLDIRNGGVTLIARGTTLQQILAEWSRVGGVEIVVRGEGFSAAPVTLLLRDLTEREALDILLRDVGGYLLVARQNAASGSSAFERILIVPATGEATLSRERPEPAVARASRFRPAIESPTLTVPEPFSSAANDDDAPPVRTPNTQAPLSDDGAGAFGAAGASDLVEALPDDQDPAATPRPSAAGVPGGDASTAAGPPPTPLLPPTPMMPNNPFGAAGTDRPGVMTPAGGPPQGVVYPPVTNRNLAPQPFTPGVAPAETTPR